MSNKKTVNLKLIILGDKGIGKTTLIKDYLQLQNSNKDNKDKKDKEKEREKYVFSQEIDSTQLKITIYEFSEKSEKLTKDINDCHCVLIIFDMSNRKSFENLLDNWLLYLRDICHYKGLVFIFGNHFLKKKPLMKIPNYIVDICVLNNNDLKLIEFSPFLLCTSARLFRWHIM